VYRLLNEEKVLVVSGSGFNYYKPDHFRVVFLPEVQVLSTALDRIGAFLERESVEVVRG
jgi:alanine-synthesizing transaminase